MLLGLGMCDNRSIASKQDIDIMKYRYFDILIS